MRLGGLMISPLRMASVETLIRTTLPSMTARTLWIFGLNVRLVFDVTFRPTPPRYFALPRRLYRRPAVVFLPVSAHCRGIFLTPKSNPRGKHCTLLPLRSKDIFLKIPQLHLRYDGQLGDNRRHTDVANPRPWRNWQTRRLQVPVSVRTWRFDSSRPQLVAFYGSTCSVEGNPCRENPRYHTDDSQKIAMNVILYATTKPQ